MVEDEIEVLECVVRISGVAGDIGGVQHGRQHDAHRVVPVVELARPQVDAGRPGGLGQVRDRRACRGVDDAIRRGADEVVANTVERGLDLALRWAGRNPRQAPARAARRRGRSGPAVGPRRAPAPAARRPPRAKMRFFVIAPSILRPPPAHGRGRNPTPPKPGTPPLRTVLRLAPAPRRDAFQDRLPAFLVLEQRTRVLRPHVTRRNRIHIHSAPGPLIGQRLGDLRHAAFGRRIRRHVDAALKRKQRSNVNDLPLPARQHVRARRAAEPEHRGQVDLDHGVPVFVGMFRRRCAPDDARVVHQDVHRAHRRHGLIDQPVRLRARAEIGGQAVCAHAGLLTDALRRLLRSRDIVQHHVRPGFGEAERNRRAQPAIGARHQRDFTVQTKHRVISPPVRARGQSRRPRTPAARSPRRTAGRRLRGWPPSSIGN